MYYVHEVGEICGRCFHKEPIGEGFFFLSKIDKYLIDLALPRIIIDYGGRATLVEAFAVVEQCDRALY